MSTGLVFDIKPFSLHDGPGIRTTVFLKGCSLRCWWCHNPESQSPNPELLLREDRCIRCGACVAVCPQAAITANGSGFHTDRARCGACGACIAECMAEAREIVGQEMTVEAVMAAIRRDRAFYEESGGGVTVSGGEPLLQAAFVRALLRACQAEGLHTALDTCGYAPTEALDAVRPFVDLFLYDLKMMDPDRHRTVTGASNARILQHLHLLSDGGHRIILRIPIIPGINDDAANLDQTGALARDLAGVERVDILPYHRIGSEKHARLGMSTPMPAVDPPSESRMFTIQQQLESYGLTVKIGG
jgi:pyruvate formate lyase activating enzyme